jgi:hypothetical protein
MHPVRRALAWLPFLAALSATVYLLIVPIWGGKATTAAVAGSGQAMTTTWTTPPQRVVDVGGPVTLAYLLVMPALAAVSGWGALRGRRWLAVGAGLLLAGGMVLGAMSIGAYYLPAVVLCVVNALVPGKALSSRAP